LITIALRGKSAAAIAIVDASEALLNDCAKTLLGILVKRHQLFYVIFCLATLEGDPYCLFDNYLQVVAISGSYPLHACLS